MIWEIRNAGIAEFAVLVCCRQDEYSDTLFSVDGKEKIWAGSPEVMPAPERRKKKSKPRADISHLWPGSIVLNQRANACLHAFLSQFGQLLELKCNDEIEYFYNVTNLRDCIDRQQSVIDEFGVIRKEVMLQEIDGDKPEIFKDPLTASVQIYANQRAKDLLEDILAREKLTGMKFSEPGSRPY